jgi:hypothetical protein
MLDMARSYRRSGYAVKASRGDTLLLENPAGLRGGATKAFEELGNGLGERPSFCRRDAAQLGGETGPMPSRAALSGKGKIASGLPG